MNYIGYNPGERENIKHKQIIEDVKQYEDLKRNVINNPMINLLKGLKDNVSNAPCKACWTTFIRSYMFSSYVAETGVYRTTYGIYPPDGFKEPGQGYLYGKIPEEGYMVEYDYRSSMMSVSLYNTMMLDYDTEKEGLTREGIIEFLKEVVEYGKSIGVNLVFMYFRTDRGLHVFLVSHSYNRSLYWSDFMNQLCNDPWYTAFTYVKGFSIRLTKKKERPEDIIAEIGITLQESESMTDANVSPHYPKLLFNSKYMGKTIELTNFLHEYPVIGDIKYALNEQVANVRFHYYLVQYGRELSLEDIARLECEIYDHEIGINTSPIDYLREDIKVLAQQALNI